MGSNCCKGDAAAGKPIRSSSSIYTRNRAGASLDDRFTASDDTGGVRLSVTAAHTGDSGLYTLVASNAAGKDTARVRLEVSPDETPTGDDPPTFLRRLQDLTVKVGTRTRFLVEIISSSECKVTWFRNERRLMEAERISLAKDGNFWCADVAVVNVDDAGRWTCTAENNGGRASCSAHLNVLVPKAYKRPEFVEELRALLTEQGTVSLECKVVGVPTPVLRWFKDSREIKAGDVFALTANAEDPTSLGTYTCEAVNCMGRAYSSSKVHVVGRTTKEGFVQTCDGLSSSSEPPPIFTKELEDQFVRICEPLNLSCHIVVPPWPRSVVWYNKDGKIEPSERYHVLEDGVGGYLLEVPLTEWSDEGEWKCVATSSGGRVGISSCYVVMDVPKNYRKPRFMENLQAVLTEEGLVSFECKVVGFPTPVLSWFKDGQELKPGDVYQLTGTNSLGSYCCIARNCMGQASSSAELTVEDIQNQLNEEEKLQLFSKNQAPKFIQGLKSVEAKIDEFFRFTVKVAIPPEPSVSWYRDGQPVDESIRCHLDIEEHGIFHLDIQNLEFLDQAEWKCVALNNFGHSVTSCFLKLIIPRHYKKPRFLENLQAVLSDEGAVNLECKVIGVPQPILKWYKDGEELKPGDIHRIISGQDGTCCLGTYTCEAQNCMGIAASSASLLGFEDSIKNKTKKVDELALQRNLSLSTIHEERTSQMYDTPVGDLTFDDKGEISFSFDGKEVSVSLYETPDLTEEEALQIVEMYADQLSENVTEHNVVELPPLRFVKETSTSGNLLMEAIIIDVSPEYFASPEEDLRTEADIEDISIADENFPRQLSLDNDPVQKTDYESYLEMAIATISDEKAEITKKSSVKKTESIKSADDFFSLSQDTSLSDEKKSDDDTQALSDIQSFTSAHSSYKTKTKDSKCSMDELKSSEITKTVLQKDDRDMVAENELPIKPRRSRRVSQGSRRSSLESEKSSSIIKETSKDQSRYSETDKKILIAKLENISSMLCKINNDIQTIEKKIIQMSEIMSSSAAASKSLEVIGSLVAPFSEIHSVAETVKESFLETREFISNLLSNLPIAFESLHQTLTIVQKCIELESDSKTLVKNTCTALIETCGEDIKYLVTEINLIISEDLTTDNKICKDLSRLTNKIVENINASLASILTKNCPKVVEEIKADDIPQIKHLKNTQKAVFSLRTSLDTLLNIIENAECEKQKNVNRIKINDIILNDMSISIQDLQAALELIEELSVEEASTNLDKFNTKVIEMVMDPTFELRSSFEKLVSKDINAESYSLFKSSLSSIKHYLHEILHEITSIQNEIGDYDILHSDNKLLLLQKIAQTLIGFENKLSKFDKMGEIKTNLTTFHQNITKTLENVIESNDHKKYYALVQICNVVNRINMLLSNVESVDYSDVTILASIVNSLEIVKNVIINNIFDTELNCTTLTNISDIIIALQDEIYLPEEMSLHVDSEHVQDISPQTYKLSEAKIIIEHLERTIGAIHTVQLMESSSDMGGDIIPVLENICPILDNFKTHIAANCTQIPNEEEIITLPSLIIKEAINELNTHVNILHLALTNNDNKVKDNNEVMSVLAETVYELNKSLEILQQDVISQYRDDISCDEININIADSVLKLQSCLVLIHEQVGIEVADEISTLEDISAIKSQADITYDNLLSPTVAELMVNESLQLLNEEKTICKAATHLQMLRFYIKIMQIPEIIEVFDSLSKHTDFMSFKIFNSRISYLNSCIESFEYPSAEEKVIGIQSYESIFQLGALAVQLFELEKCLSILDYNDIPSYVQILEKPLDKLTNIFKQLTNFKKCLINFISVVIPAFNLSEQTIQISNTINELKKLCEELKNVLESSTNMPLEYKTKIEVKTLKESLIYLLHVTNLSEHGIINIGELKLSIERLFRNIIKVQESLMRYSPQSLDSLSEETALLLIMNDIEHRIINLQEYDFVNISHISDISCYLSPKIALDSNSEHLKIADVVFETVAHLIQDSACFSEPQLKIIENFLNNCKSQILVMNYLTQKDLTHKRFIRLAQEFITLKKNFYDFNIVKWNEEYVPAEINMHLNTILEHTDKYLIYFQKLLIAIARSNAVILYEAPLINLQDLNEACKDIKNTNEYSCVKQIMNILNDYPALKSAIDNTQVNLIKEIEANSFDTMNTYSILEDKLNQIKSIVEINEPDTETDHVNLFKELQTCIDNHQGYRNAFGTGKTLVIIKCLSEFINILLKHVQKNTAFLKITTERSEEINLTQELKLNIYEPLKVLNSQLSSMQEVILNDPNVEKSQIDSNKRDSILDTITNINKCFHQLNQLQETGVLQFKENDMLLIEQFDKEVLNMHYAVISLAAVRSSEIFDEITKSITSLENELLFFKTKLGYMPENSLYKVKAVKKLIYHLDQYIDTVRETKTVINEEILSHSLSTAQKLRENYFEILSNNLDRDLQFGCPQIQLLEQLEIAIKSFREQFSENIIKLVPTTNTNLLQRVTQTTEQLQADITLMLGIETTSQAPLEMIEDTGSDLTNSIEKFDPIIENIASENIEISSTINVPMELTDSEYFKPEIKTDNAIPVTLTSNIDTVVNERMLETQVNNNNIDSDILKIECVPDVNIHLSSGQPKEEDIATQAITIAIVKDYEELPVMVAVKEEENLFMSTNETLLSNTEVFINEDYTHQFNKVPVTMQEKLRQLISSVKDLRNSLSPDFNVGGIFNSGNIQFISSRDMAKNLKNILFQLMENPSVWTDSEDLQTVKHSIICLYDAIKHFADLTEDMTQAYNKENKTINSIRSQEDQEISLIDNIDNDTTEKVKILVATPVTTIMTISSEQCNLKIQQAYPLVVNKTVIDVDETATCTTDNLAQLDMILTKQENITASDEPIYIEQIYVTELIEKPTTSNEITHKNIQDINLKTESTSSMLTDADDTTINDQEVRFSHMTDNESLYVGNSALKAQTCTCPLIVNEIVSKLNKTVDCSIEHLELRDIIPINKENITISHKSQDFIEIPATKAIVPSSLSKETSKADIFDFDLQYKAESVYLIAADDVAVLDIIENQEMPQCFAGRIVETDYETCKLVSQNTRQGDNTANISIDILEFLDGTTIKNGNVNAFEESTDTIQINVTEVVIEKQTLTKETTYTDITDSNLMSESRVFVEADNISINNQEVCFPEVTDDASLCVGTRALESQAFQFESSIEHLELLDINPTNIENITTSEKSQDFTHINATEKFVKQSFSSKEDSNVNITDLELNPVSEYADGVAVGPCPFITDDFALLYFKDSLVESNQESFQIIVKQTFSQEDEIGNSTIEESDLLIKPLTEKCSVLVESMENEQDPSLVQNLRLMNTLERNNMESKVLLGQDLNIDLDWASKLLNFLPAEDVPQLQDTYEAFQVSSISHLETLVADIGEKTKILSNNRTAEEDNNLKDDLEEMQSIIIKLKNDYDAPVNDTLNETLNDLECSVRSVQIQINENSPTDLLKEACTTLTLLVNNLKENQKDYVNNTLQKESSLDYMLQKCSDSTDNSVTLVDIASNVCFVSTSNLDVIVISLSELKAALKMLRTFFLGDVETLIENGIEILEKLNFAEEQIFLLEKELNGENHLEASEKDNLLTAIHSVYGAVSNMSNTLASVQKRYLYENYGKPSQIILHCIRDVRKISVMESSNLENWDKLSSSLRKILNHFEDIKFYINLDKTARIPNDIDFTLMILFELQENLNIIHGEFDSETDERISKAVISIKNTIKFLESLNSLEVKKKIPIFKDISVKVLAVTNYIRDTLQSHKKEIQISEGLTIKALPRQQGEADEKNIENIHENEQPILQNTEIDVYTTKSIHEKINEHPGEIFVECKTFEHIESEICQQVYTITESMEPNNKIIEEVSSLILDTQYESKNTNEQEQEDKERMTHDDIFQNKNLNSMLKHMKESKTDEISSMNAVAGMSTFIGENISNEEFISEPSLQGETGLLQIHKGNIKEENVDVLCTNENQKIIDREPKTEAFTESTKELNLYREKDVKKIFKEEKKSSIEDESLESKDSESGSQETVGQTKESEATKYEGNVENLEVEIDNNVSADNVPLQKPPKLQKEEDKENYEDITTENAGILNEKAESCEKPIIKENFVVKLEQENSFLLIDNEEVINEQIEKKELKQEKDAPIHIEGENFMEKHTKEEHFHLDHKQVKEMRSQQEKENIEKQQITQHAFKLPQNQEEYQHRQMQRQSLECESIEEDKFLLEQKEDKDSCFQKEINLLENKQTEEAVKDIKLKEEKEENQVLIEKNYLDKKRIQAKELKFQQKQKDEAHLPKDKKEIEEEEIKCQQMQKEKAHLQKETDFSENKPIEKYENYMKENEKDEVRLQQENENYQKQKVAKEQNELEQENDPDVHLQAQQKAVKYKLVEEEKLSLKQEEEESTRLQQDKENFEEQQIKKEIQKLKQKQEDDETVQTQGESLAYKQFEEKEQISKQKVIEKLRLQEENNVIVKKDMDEEDIISKPKNEEEARNLNERLTDGKQIEEEDLELNKMQDEILIDKEQNNEEKLNLKPKEEEVRFQQENENFEKQANDKDTNTIEQIHDVDVPLQEQHKSIKCEREGEEELVLKQEKEENVHLQHGKEIFEEPIVKDEKHKLKQKQEEDETLQIQGKSLTYQHLEEKELILKQNEKEELCLQKVNDVNVKKDISEEDVNLKPIQEEARNVMKRLIDEKQIEDKALELQQKQDKDVKDQKQTDHQELNLKQKEDEQVRLQIENNNFETHELKKEKCRLEQIEDVDVHLQMQQKNDTPTDKRVEKEKNLLKQEEEEVTRPQQDKENFEEQKIIKEIHEFKQKQKEDEILQTQGNSLEYKQIEEKELILKQQEKEEPRLQEEKNGNVKKDINKEDVNSNLTKEDEAKNLIVILVNEKQTKIEELELKQKQDENFIDNKQIKEKELNLKHKKEEEVSSQTENKSFEIKNNEKEGNRLEQKQNVDLHLQAQQQKYKRKEEEIFILKQEEEEGARLQKDKENFEEQNIKEEIQKLKQKQEEDENLQTHEECLPYKQFEEKKLILNQNEKEELCLQKVNDVNVKKDISEEDVNLTPIQEEARNVMKRLIDEKQIEDKALELQQKQDKDVKDQKQTDHQELNLKHKEDEQVRSQLENNNFETHELKKERSRLEQIEDVDVHPQVQQKSETPTDKRVEEEKLLLQQEEEEVACPQPDKENCEEQKIIEEIHEFKQKQKKDEILQTQGDTLEYKQIEEKELILKQEEKEEPCLQEENNGYVKKDINEKDVNSNLTKEDEARNLIVILVDEEQIKIEELELKQKQDEDIMDNKQMKEKELSFNHKKEEVRLNIENENFEMQEYEKEKNRLEKEQDVDVHLQAQQESIKYTRIEDETFLLKQNEEECAHLQQGKENFENQNIIEKIHEFQQKQEEDEILLTHGDSFEYKQMEEKELILKQKEKEEPCLQEEKNVIVKKYVNEEDVNAKPQKEEEVQNAIERLIDEKRNVEELDKLDKQKQNEDLIDSRLTKEEKLSLNKKKEEEVRLNTENENFEMQEYKEENNPLEKEQNVDVHLQAQQESIKYKRIEEEKKLLKQEEEECAHLQQGKEKYEKQKFIEEIHEFKQKQGECEILHRQGDSFEFKQIDEKELILKQKEKEEPCLQEEKNVIVKKYVNKENLNAKPQKEEEARNIIERLIDEKQNMEEKDLKQKQNEDLIDSSHIKEEELSLNHKKEEGVPLNIENENFEMQEYEEEKNRLEKEQDVDVHLQAQRESIKYKRIEEEKILLKQEEEKCARLQQGKENYEKQKIIEEIHEFTQKQEEDEILHTQGDSFEYKQIEEKELILKQKEKEEPCLQEEKNVIVKKYVNEEELNAKPQKKEEARNIIERLTDENQIKNEELDLKQKKEEKLRLNTVNEKYEMQEYEKAKIQLEQKQDIVMHLQAHPESLEYKQIKEKNHSLIQKEVDEAHFQQEKDIIENKQIDGEEQNKNEVRISKEINNLEKDFDEELLKKMQYKAHLRKENVKQVEEEVHNLKREQEDKVILKQENEFFDEQELEREKTKLEQNHVEIIQLQPQSESLEYKRTEEDKLTLKQEVEDESQHQRVEEELILKQNQERFLNIKTEINKKQAEGEETKLKQDEVTEENKQFNNELVEKEKLMIKPKHEGEKFIEKVYLDEKLFQENDLILKQKKNEHISIEKKQTEAEELILIQKEKEIIGNKQIEEEELELETEQKNDAQLQRFIKNLEEKTIETKEYKQNQEEEAHLQKENENLKKEKSGEIKLKKKQGKVLRLRDEQNHVAKKRIEDKKLDIKQKIIEDVHLQIEQKDLESKRIEVKEIKQKHDEDVIVDEILKNQNQGEETLNQKESEDVIKKVHEVEITVMNKLEDVTKSLHNETGYQDEEGNYVLGQKQKDYAIRKTVTEDLKKKQIKEEMSSLKQKEEAHFQNEKKQEIEKKINDEVDFNMKQKCDDEVEKELIVKDMIKKKDKQDEQACLENKKADINEGQLKLAHGNEKAAFLLKEKQSAESKRKSEEKLKSERDKKFEIKHDTVLVEAGSHNQDYNSLQTQKYHTYYELHSRSNNYENIESNRNKFKSKGGYNEETEVFKTGIESGYTSIKKNKSERKENPKCPINSNTDFNLEFFRTSNYRERTFDDSDLFTDIGLYKHNTQILNQELRHRSPYLSDAMYDRNSVPRERLGNEIRKQKALSETRSSYIDLEKKMHHSKRKPTFSTFLTDRTAVEGSRVKLTCSAISPNDLTVTWFKNGVSLNDKLKYHSKVVDGLITLEVLNAVPADSAEYSCTVQNENGSISTSAKLKVYPSFEASPIPPTFTRSIRDKYHQAGNELLLECRIRGQPLPSITWFKDGKPITFDHRYQAYYLADGVCRLAIDSPVPSDSGNYTCKAENTVWSDQISHVVNFTGTENRLSLNFATIERSRFNRKIAESRRPHFSNILPDYKVTCGGTIGLQVEVKGSPTKVEWLREGDSVLDTYKNAKAFVEHELYTLALTDVSVQESGIYTCRAWGPYDSNHVDMNATITIVQPNEIDGKPAIIIGRPAKDMIISVGEDFNISFRVQGEPKPRVIFMKGIRDITNSQRVCKMTSDDYVKFTLKRSVVSDAGTYCILARNAYGCDRAFVTLVVRQRASSENLISDWTYPMDDTSLLIATSHKTVPERIPGEPTAVDGGNNWVSLAWPKSDCKSSSSVLAYKVESWLLGKEGGARWVELGSTPLNTLDVFNLKQGEKYHFRVTPRNKYGWGESVHTSVPIGIGIAGDRPDFTQILPGQLKILAGETANLNCSVTGKPTPQVVWMKNGHELEEQSNRIIMTYDGQNCGLTIKNIDQEDEGRYSCEASNVIGRSSTYARLAVVRDKSIWQADAKLKRERSSEGVGEYPPQFTMRLRDRRVQATYPVRLTCQIVGNPTPSITWFKDGEKVTINDRHTQSQDEQFHTLEIAPTTLDDGGVYEATARNSCGAVSCRCNLVVDKGIRAYLAPEFCCGLEPLYQVNEGDELRISAVVEAYPSVGVTWYRDGVRLRPSRRVVMTLDRDGQIELALASVTSREAGIYMCSASNEVGKATTSAKVEVLENNSASTIRTPNIIISDIIQSKDPMFIRKPRSSEAYEGETVIIECEVIGNPKPDVYWLRDFLKPDYYRDASHFKRVGDGPEYRFEIPHAKLDYTGAYSVVAKNVHGEAKAIISLQILAKDINSGKDSHNIRYGRVDVIPKFERMLTDLLCYDGDTAEFECHITGSPEPDIRWFHYNEIIRECDDFEMIYESGTARFKIKQVTAEDEGIYKCEASNTLGRVNSTACLVVYPPGEPNTLSQRLRRPPLLLSTASTPRSTPRSTPTRSISRTRTPGLEPSRLSSPCRQMPPKFYTYPFNKVVEEGETVVFKCAVKGLPSPWATWDKDGIVITPSTRITIKEKDMMRILEIEEVTIEDVGLYRITLENDLGRVEASARLEVITHQGKFYAGVRSYSASPRRSLSCKRSLHPSSRQD